MPTGPLSPSELVRRATRYRPGRLARGTLNLSGGMVVQGGLQALMLIVLARALGVSQYGGFIAATALITLFVPLAGMGYGFLLVRDSVRDQGRFREAFGRSLIMLAVTAVPLVVLTGLVGRLILPAGVSTTTILVLAVSELMFAPVSELVARAYQAVERSGRMTLWRTALFAVRVLALAVSWPISGLTAASAAFIYAGSALAVAVAAIILSARELGAPRFSSSGLFAYAADGFHFSINYFAFRMNSDIDKVMLARLAGLSTAGFVGAAFRLVVGVMLPVRALLEAGYARFFNAGALGVEGSFVLAKKLLPVPLVYSILTGIGVFAFAGLAPILLGEEFRSSVHVLRWFALYPLAALLHYGLDTMLTTSNRQQIAAWVMLGGASLNIVMNLWLIPLIGWKGAVLSAYASEFAIITVYWLALWRGRSEVKAGGTATRR